MRAVKDPKTYHAWINMKMRCDSPRHPSYKYYGGRGITYDSRWLLYSNFVEDMGYAPQGLTLDRKDSDKGYCKENCQWTTWAKQAGNKGRRTDNTSGVIGVHFQADRGVWVARTGRQEGRKQLYRGSDFSKACDAMRKFTYPNEYPDNSEPGD